MGLFDSFKKNAKQDNFDGILKAYAKGCVVPMKDVDDETFSQEILGPGVAIEPSEGCIYAPCDGEVSLIADTKHAISISAPNDAELLIHIGLDTVELNGDGFTPHVSVGDKVKTGDKLVSFDMELIKDKGYKVTTPIIVCNHDDYKTIEPIASGEINVGEDLLKVEK
jgi:glucose PTS system EIICBA or EIICB component